MINDNRMQFYSKCRQIMRVKELEAMQIGGHVNLKPHKFEIAEINL